MTQRPRKKAIATRHGRPAHENWKGRLRQSRVNEIGLSAALAEIRREPAQGARR